ncbi:ABC transporter ATP-binding protein [Culicoidibacter larvae]|uniref:ATP-binding cassette domain-containing protein n=1 Tax=Culicoidibacter larvae TaxID=2579976 RepID=A0A5R8QHV0_9FIRM|nr:ATP-binding cassette domain-containing protein [Culicoidibacter larvae]TLG77260.1 ATP-binding cassette domain-containing protein [Culicoidibacter larvae]
MSALLTLENIQKTFHAGTVNENHVLKGVNLSLAHGDFVTVIGGNGAGKSTLLNTIAGTLLADSGTITLDGANITKHSVEKRSKCIGRVFQDPRLGTATRLSIEENLTLAMNRGRTPSIFSRITNKDRNFFREQLVSLDLGLEERLKAEVGLLSGGQRQALTLLMATLIAPKLLLLDEHTAALDPKTSQSVLALTDKLVAEKNLTTIMITHNMDDALKHGNRLIMLHEGQIVVDVSGAEKAQLGVTDLLALFQKNSGTELVDDSVLLR